MPLVAALTSALIASLICLTVTGSFSSVNTWSAERGEAC